MLIRGTTISCTSNITAVSISVLILGCAEARGRDNIMVVLAAGCLGHANDAADRLRLGLEFWVLA
eukprot:CAMPEP_0202341576 /NCGR_PEP_ID=MMETSP1126-20121109/2512_1 /ASSEMBLY_ACC=CAM_ASM_000457 /TAXON_ID=3047 /ORGANISM="Dunaliella tertiolecta, Strain CCMP1320" /LENGTH=64 /DNA_ID=CAMNT_0048932413 /DNA_START=174 /DNA_END=368 /DNA_ORIENTATION=+